MNVNKVFKFFLAGILTVILVGCSEASSGGEDKENEQKTQEDVTLTGSVVIDGSGTVYPLMAKIAETYMIEKAENVSVEVSRAGTSAGFKKFLIKDGTDFNNASREIKDEEQQAADDLNIEIKELKVALDGLTFVVNKDNTWANSLTDEQLKSIFLADGTVQKWSDINQEWPDEYINTYGPNENHGTYEFFYENVLEELDLRDDVNLQQEYSTLVNLIADDKYGIAFFGFGYFMNNGDKLKAVSVDFGDGAVEPSLDTIAEDGEYSTFTRPVFTYLNVNHAKEKRQVLDYAIYTMKNINKYAGVTGFAPIPNNEVEENINFLEGLK